MEPKSVYVLTEKTPGENDWLQMYKWTVKDAGFKVAGYLDPYALENEAIVGKLQSADYIIIDTPGSDSAMNQRLFRLLAGDALREIPASFISGEIQQVAKDYVLVSGEPESSLKHVRLRNKGLASKVMVGSHKGAPYMLDVKGMDFSLFEAAIQQAVRIAEEHRNKLGR